MYYILFNVIYIIYVFKLYILNIIHCYIYHTLHFYFIHKHIFVTDYRLYINVINVIRMYQKTSQETNLDTEPQDRLNGSVCACRTNVKHEHIAC